MKRFKTKSDYSKLSRITFIKGLGITLGAAATVLFLWVLTRGHLADSIVKWIAYSFSMSDDAANMAYFIIVRFVISIAITKKHLLAA